MQSSPPRDDKGYRLPDAGRDWLAVLPARREATMLYSFDNDLFKLWRNMR
jgi:hypothetical protein